MRFNPPENIQNLHLADENITYPDFLQHNNSKEKENMPRIHTRRILNKDESRKNLETSNSNATLEKYSSIEGKVSQIAKRARAI